MSDQSDLQSRNRFDRELAYWRNEIDRRSRNEADFAASRVRLEGIATRIERRIALLENSPTGSRQKMESEVDAMMWQLARETCRTHLGITSRVAMA